MPTVPWLTATLALCSVSAPAPALGAPLPVHPGVVAAADAAWAARGPESYAALRQLWRTWDRGDPTHVEEALTALSEDRARPAPERAYARVLVAYARRRRGDLDGAEREIAALGFVRRWQVLGPFDNEGKSGLQQAFAPEVELRDPILPGRAYDGKERLVRWRESPDVFAYGWIDLGALLRPREHICAYAVAFARARPGTPETRPVTLWVGAAGAYKLFWNGDEVLRDPVYRNLDVDRAAATVRLGPGWNRITVKVCGDDDAPTFSLRVGDPHGGPDPDLEVTAERSASEAPTRPAAPPARGASGGREVLGPLQAFERITARRGVTPAALEAHARYLHVTGGDSPTEHRARDLARRAAELAPTVPRLLLAGELSEDRNQRALWVERAEALAGPRHAHTEILLARAELARTGSNWRDAVPFYDRVLALDPDHIGALLGRVDLYVQAGLRRTAVAVLEEALLRMPDSVALLRAAAMQLRAVGRDADAADVEARYAALRFDDPGWLTEQVDLALARRDGPGAERWLARLLRLEPTELASHALAARTHRGLGHPERALDAYRQALALAPEDTGALRALASLHGELGRRDEQQRLLRQVLALAPQAKDVREHLEHIEPPRPRADEAYAWEKERFLPLGTAPAGPHNRRSLRELSVTTVFPNGLSSRFRQVVFQPLTDEAAASARDYAFGYEADRQQVQLRAARVFRKDGKVDEAIESGEAPANDPSISMYTSARTFYVRLPRLNAGDVVELRYRIEDVTARNEFADYFGEIVHLQSSDPIASMEYVLITPRSRPIHHFATPLPGLRHEVRDDGPERRIHRFSVEKVPPIVPEPWMPPWPEVAAHVHVSTYRTWDEVGAWYWGLSRDALDVDDEVRRKARELTRGIEDPKEKVKAVYRFVTGSTRYVALEFGIEGYRPRRCTQTLARGWGDCKDKAVVLVTLLRELGIPAHLVILRTALRGEIETRPASLAPFDHAVAYVPSLDLYLDGTAEGSGTTELPVFDRGAIGLLIEDGKSRLVRLPQPPPEESVRRRRLDATLAPDGSATIEVAVESSGAYAAELRRRYQAESTQRQRLTHDVGAFVGGIELSPGKQGAELEALDVERPVRFTVRGRATAFSRREGDALSLPVGPREDLVRTFASLSSRKLDLKLRALTSLVDEWTLRFSPALRVVSAPTPTSRDTPFGKVSVEVEQASGKISVKSSLAMKKDRVRPEEYQAFRAFCEEVDRAFGQRVLLGR